MKLFLALLILISTQLAWSKERCASSCSKGCMDEIDRWQVIVDKHVLKCGDFEDELYRALEWGSGPGDQCAENCSKLCRSRIKGRLTISKMHYTKCKRTGPKKPDPKKPDPKKPDPKKPDPKKCASSDNTLKCRQFRCKNRLKTFRRTWTDDQLGVACKSGRGDCVVFFAIMSSSATPKGIASYCP
ncbi:MAG: hypothetical protein HOE90_05715 [Bacteriovoracaceae bacterium]|nr:hypothetical protein [Bacteriovoracaceae bacterium]